MFATTSHQPMRTARRTAEGWVRVDRRPSRRAQLLAELPKQYGGRS